MACFCFLRNVTEILANGLTPYEARFGTPFKGPKIPFGAMVEYLPSAPKDEERRWKYGSKALHGFFIGYDQRAGGSWSGDLYVADWDEIENADMASDGPGRA